MSETGSLLRQAAPFAAGLVAGLALALVLPRGSRERASSDRSSDPACRTVCTNNPADLITVGPAEARTAAAPAPPPSAARSAAFPPYPPLPPAPSLALPAGPPAPYRPPTAGPEPPPSPTDAARASPPPADAVAPPPPPPPPPAPVAPAAPPPASADAAPPAPASPPAQAESAAVLSVRQALARDDLVTALGYYLLVSLNAPPAQRAEVQAAIRETGARQVSELSATDCNRAQAVFRMLQARGLAPERSAFHEGCAPP